MPTSLAELLVVLGLVGVCSAVALAPRGQARDAAMKQQAGMVRQLQAEIQRIGE